MPYNSGELTECRGTGSMKWDVPEGELLMRVADMDFKTAPEIREALMKWAVHGIFGYTVVPDAWRETVTSWWERRHGSVMEEDWLVFTTGVVPAIPSSIRKLTAVGENVLVQVPAYGIFLNSIRSNGQNTIENRPFYDEAGCQVDQEDSEKKLSDSQTTLMILYNSHNPIGMIWTWEELGRIRELCAVSRAKIMSDEIHYDPIEPGHGYIPFALVSETCAQNSVTCIVPTRAFNLAGLQTAAVMVPNKELHHKMERALDTDEVAEPNTFAIEATTVTFTKGGGWLDALRVYLVEDRKTVRKFLNDEIPEMPLVLAHTTYLLWPDCRKIIVDTSELCRYLRKETRLYLLAGMVYGGNGREFLRMNTACPKERLLDGLERLKQGVRTHEEYAAGSC